MKTKIYYLATTLVLILLCLNTRAQAKKILFLSNVNPPVPADSLIVDSIKLWGYDVVPVNTDEFAVADYASYDALYISESIGSSGANPFQVAGYPIPCLCSEPYVVRSNRWGWIDHSDTTLWARHDAGTDALTTVITDNTHYITRGYTTNEEVQWSTATEYAAVPSFIAYDISGAVSGAVPLAKSKAPELTTAAGLHNLWAIPEGSTVTDITANPVTLKRMVFFNTHTEALTVGTHTAGLYNIIHRSLQWILKEDPALAVQKLESGFSSVNLLANPVRDLGIISFHLEKPGMVSFSAVNMLGQRTELSVKESYSAGRNEISFNTSELNAGIYIYQLKVKESLYTGKMHILK
jgi:hypothetical protein